MPIDRLSSSNLFIRFYKNALKERGKETIWAIVLFLLKCLFSKSFLQNPISYILLFLSKIPKSNNAKSSKEQQLKKLLLES